MGCNKVLSIFRLDSSIALGTLGIQTNSPFKVVYHSGMREMHNRKQKQILLSATGILKSYCYAN